MATGRTASFAQARDSLLRYCNHLRHLWHKVQSGKEVWLAGGNYFWCHALECGVRVKLQLFLLRVLAGRFFSICANVLQFQNVYAPPSLLHYPRIFLADSNIFFLLLFSYKLLKVHRKCKKTNILVTMTSNVEPLKKIPDDYNADSNCLFSIWSFIKSKSWMGGNSSGNDNVFNLSLTCDSVSFKSHYLIESLTRLTASGWFLSYT